MVVTEAEEAVAVFTVAVVAVFTAVAVVVFMAAEAATTVVADIAAAMVVTVATEDARVSTAGVARLAACAEVRCPGAIPAPIEAGLGRVEVLEPLRRAGIRLDPATVWE